MGLSVATVDWVTRQTLAHPPTSACFSSVGGGSGCRVTPGYHPTPYTDPWGRHSSLRWSRSACRWPDSTSRSARQASAVLLNLYVGGLTCILAGFQQELGRGPGSDPALASARCPIDVPRDLFSPVSALCNLGSTTTWVPRETSSVQTGPSVGL